MTPEKLANIKTAIIGLLPHWYVLKRQEKHKTFISLFNEQKKKGTTKIPHEEIKFRSIISVQGLGYSGSGALLDLLREYPIEVLGFVDKFHGSKADASNSFPEIELLRLPGGFFEMEKFLNSENIFHNTAILNRMVKLFESSGLYNYNEEIRKYMISFFDSIVDFSIDNLSRTYYNPYLTSYNEKSSIFFLKKHTIKEFRNKCRDVLNVIFNRIETTKDILAVDQLCSDYEMDIDRNSEYINNLKTIVVTRDPRDLYVWTMMINCEWIAHDSVEDFIKWYKITYHNIDYSYGNTNYLVVRYENLIWDYDNTVARVEKYLGLESAKHISKFSCFDPRLSSKFTKLYKLHPEYTDDVQLIEKSLREYCSAIID